MVATTQTAPASAGLLKSHIPAAVSSNNCASTDLAVPRIANGVALRCNGNNNTTFTGSSATTLLEVEERGNGST